MLFSNNRKLPFLPVLILFVGLILSACTISSTSEIDPESLANFVVEPIFQDFYEFLGGFERIGNPISPLIHDGPIQKQYFEAVLMHYLPDSPPSQQYSLAPLGLDLGQSDAPLQDPDLENVLFVDGYIIYEGFEELYRELGAQRYVGKPLTGVRYSESLNRVEQYFENIGFYQHLDDPIVRLMPLGLAACQGTCAQLVSNPSAIIEIDLPYGEPFTSTVAKIGDALVGSRIAGPYRTSDGYLEVIYENMLLFALPDSQIATPRPIATILGISPEPLVARLDNPNVIFFGIEGDLGHNIALPFNQFLEQHGGFEFSGQPISELEAQEDGSARQCFSNLCLRYIQTLLGRVEPVALGLEYKRLYYDQPNLTTSFEDKVVNIEAWEENSRISSQQQQLVHVSLYSGSQLLPGLQPSLLLSLPSQAQSLYQMPATDANGHTQISLPPISAPNGTLITYEVCIETPELERQCALDSFLIWGN